MKNTIIPKIFLICLLFIGICFYFLYVISSQGVWSTHWSKYDVAKVMFDSYGIPTISANSWSKLIEAQGYVMASERLWQMDLLRRHSSGRLSEWLGDVALSSDIQKVKEDWQGVATKAVKSLSPEERFFCDTFAKGVNDFIFKNKNSWGIEYIILNIVPEPWSCVDSVLVFMGLAQNLSSSAFRELDQMIWKANLNYTWRNFLFAKYHPWSNPLIQQPNINKKSYKLYPSKNQFLKKSSVSDYSNVQNIYEGPEAMHGSNSWVWSNGDKTFLANDPHLNHTVPQLWFANRLRLSEQKWVVGLSVVGLFGVIIGMNSNIGWGLTNVLEDVDDLVEETINFKNMHYVALNINKMPFWKPLILKKHRIKIRGSQKYIDINVPFTHRGPLVQSPNIPNKYYSRMWLGFTKEAIRLPIVALNRAQNWQEFNKAIDNLYLPTQAIVFADRKGQIGLRISGISIKRQHYNDNTKIPLSEKGDWISVSDVSLRPRLLVNNATAKNPKFIVAANSRLVADDSLIQAEWSNEDRKHRIEQILSSKKDFSLKDMENIQMDTYSLFHVLLLKWIIKHASIFNTNNFANKIKTKWLNWNGFSTDDPIIFAQALDIEKTLYNILLNKVKDSFLSDVPYVPSYKYFLSRAWLLTSLQHTLGFEAFGFNNQDLADYLVISIINKIYFYNQLLYLKPNSINKINYPYFPSINKWFTQHPLYGRVFLFSNLFKIESFKQFGYSDLIRTELPFKGANFRLVFDMKNLLNSRWVFPVGQSGHIRSKHYKDMQKRWIQNQRIPVFDSRFKWE